MAENQKLLIPSKSENIVLVEKLVDDVCDLFDIKEDIYGHILVALTEAVNNALQHGNKANPDKHIEVTFKVKSEILYFTVKDQGSGFDYTNLADPTDPKNIEKPTGRGIFLMKHLADNVAFEDKGTKVVLEFKLNK
ncbi:MAG: ATP-binding protein [Bacteroidota bacterium]